MPVLSIIIPVYNEKDTILQILKKINQVDFSNLNFEKEIILIDDKSTDGTRELIKNLEDSYTVLFNEKNSGKSSSLRRGIEAATGDWIIIQDADLEYDPADIYKLLELALRENAQVVYGSRTLNKDNQKRRYSGMVFAIGGLFVTWVTNLLYNTKITDEPTCYKLFKTDLLKSLPLKCQRFEFCPEVTARVAKKKIKIHELPINYYPRHKNEGKKINWRDGVEAIWTLIKYRFKK